MAKIDIVFDGPPGPTAGRFVEVEDASGKSINVGEWIDRGNGLWALRIPDPRRDAAVQEKKCDCSCHIYHGVGLAVARECCLVQHGEG